jgi:hypothetical protein
MAYITENMIQYSGKELTKITDLTGMDLTHCGSTGIAIITDYYAEYIYSLLFGDVITHRFKTIEAMRKWNNNYNAIMIAIPIGMAITRLEERWKEKDHAT